MQNKSHHFFINCFQLWYKENEQKERNILPKRGIYPGRTTQPRLDTLDQMPMKQHDMTLSTFSRHPLGQPGEVAHLQCL